MREVVGSENHSQQRFTRGRFSAHWALQAGQLALLEFFVQSERFDPVKPPDNLFGDQQTCETALKKQGNSLCLLRMELMTDAQQLAAETWKNAEVLIEHFEQALRAGQESEPLFHELVSRLRTTTGAQSVSLVGLQDGHVKTLALSGVAISANHDETTIDESRLTTSRAWSSDSKLELSLCFDNPIPLAIRQPLAELSEALLDLARCAYLTSQVTL